MAAPAKDVVLRPIDGGLHDTVNPLLAENGEAADVQNVNFDRHSIRRANGCTKLHRSRLKQGAVRLTPNPQQLTSFGVFPWKWPYAMVPFHQRWTDLSQGARFEVHFEMHGRLDRSLSGSDRQAIDANARIGGECQFMPLLAQGALDCEEPIWMLGVGILRPSGQSQGAASVNMKEENTIRPMFCWYDATVQSMKWAAADITILPGGRYNLSVTIHATSGGSSRFQVNGDVVAAIDNLGGAFPNDVFQLPAATNLAVSTDRKYAVYIGRGYARDGRISTTLQPKRRMFGGSYSVVSTGGSASTIVFANNEFTFTGATVSSYLGYRARCLTGAQAGLIRIITNWNNGTDTFTTDAFPGSVAGQTFDIIPPWEIVPQDVTIQEVRLFEKGETDAQYPRLAFIKALESYVAPQSQPDLNPADHPQWGNKVTTTLTHLPLDDDGGSVLKSTTPDRDDGFFCGGVVPIAAGGGLVGDRRVFLDGERAALAYKLESHPGLAKLFQQQLGKNTFGNAQMNVMGRMGFMLASDIFRDETAGAIGTLPYQTLFSWGNPASTDPTDKVIELRWCKDSAGTRTLYFTGLDQGSGPSATVNMSPAGGISPDVGVWYEMIFGVECPTDGSATHNVYIVVTDGTEVVGGYKTTITLNSSPRDRDPSKYTLLLFGASVFGNSNQGNGTMNACPMVVDEVGFGLTTVDVKPASGSGIPTTIAKWFRLGAVRKSEEMFPPISWRAGVGTLTKGSDVVTSPDAVSFFKNVIPSDNPRRKLLQIAGREVVVKEPDRANKTFRELKLCRDTTTSGLRLTEPWLEQTLQAAALNVIPHLGYSLLEPLEDELDLSVNATPASGENWALTRNVFKDAGALGLEFAWALLPVSVALPPQLFAPRWGRGIVTNLIPRIDGLKQLKRSDGKRFLIAATGGSLYEIDHRWRKDHPFRGLAVTSGAGSRHESCFEFRNVSTGERLRREFADDINLYFSRLTDPLPFEGIEIEDGSGKAEFPPLWTPAGGASDPSHWVTVEAWVKIPSVEGRRTIAARHRRISFDVDATVGLEAILAEETNFWFYLEGGVPRVEFALADTAGGQLRTTFELSPGGAGVTRWNRQRREIRPNEWVHVCAVIQATNGAGFGTSYCFINGKRYTMNQLTGASVVPNQIPAATSDPGAITRTMIGALGNRESATGFQYGLGGRMAGFRLTYGAFYGLDGSNIPVEFVPTPIENGTAATNGTVKVAVQMGEGFDEFLSCSPSANFLRVHYAGDGPVHLISGLGKIDRSKGDTPYTMDTFNDVLYVTNNKGPVVRFDGESAARAGLPPPVGLIRNVSTKRVPLHQQGNGAAGPSSVGYGTLELTAGGFTAATGYTFTQADVGRLLWVPNEGNFNSGVADKAADYFGVIATVTGTGAGTLRPAPYAEHVTGAGNAVAFTVFDSKSDQASSNDDALRAIERMSKDSTPWHRGRLEPGGVAAGSNNLSPRRDDNSAVEGNTPTNAACLHFRGNQYLRVAPFKIAGSAEGSDDWPPRLGDILEFKCYLKLDELPMADVVLFEVAKDARSGVRLAIVEGGKFEFRFFDVGISDFRSIKTTGKCFTIGQWYYVRFRYKFKSVGRWALDSVGGWEPDLRWLNRRASNLGALNQHRDGLWIYACEGHHRKGGAKAVTNYYEGESDVGPAATLLTLPGAHANLGSAGTSARGTTASHSMCLLNVGLLKAQPFLTPLEGDPAATVPSAASTPRTGILINITDNTSVAIGNGSNFDFPAGAIDFYLPRSLSMNRDDAFERKPGDGVNATTHVRLDAVGAPPQPRTFLNQNAATTTLTNVPFLGNMSAASPGDPPYGKSEALAAIVRVWNQSGGGAIDSSPRVLALVHVGNSDLENATAAGANNGSFRLTDDTAYGGDGLGVLKAGAVALANGTDVVATFELPSGDNQAASSVNKNVLPTLLEHGTNPVGKLDQPDASEAELRIGGSPEALKPGAGVSGVIGYIDDVSVSCKRIATHTTATYLSDQTPPDAFFHGPVDSRIGSLPRLACRPDASHLDVSAAGNATGVATLSFRLDELTGDIIAKTAATGTTAESNISVPNGKIEKSEDRVQPGGSHRFRITFFDPDQLAESNPSEEFLVQVGNREGSGDYLDSESGFVLDGVPVAGDLRPRLHRRVYKTLADGGVFYLAAEIPDNRTTSFLVTPSQSLLAIGKVLEIDNFPPPRCRIVKALEERMLYGGIDEAPSTVRWSVPFQPETVPGINVQFLESGEGNPLSAIGVLFGSAILFKRDSAFLLTNTAQGFTIERVESDAGSVSHNAIVAVDNMLIFPSEKGIFSFSGTGRVHYLSGKIERTYRRKQQIAALPQSFAIYDREKDQYLLAVRLRTEELEAVSAVAGPEEEFARYLLSLELRSMPEVGYAPVFSSEVHEQGIDAIATFDEEETDVQAIAIGTPGGFVAVLNDTQYRMVRSGSLYGTLTPVVSAYAAPSRLTLATATDQLKDNLADAPALLLSSAGLLKQRVVILHAFDNAASPALLMRRTPSGFAVAAGDTLEIGGYELVWQSKWFDVGEEGTRKRWFWLDLTFGAVAGGTFYVDILCDYSEVASFTKTVSMSTGRDSVFLTGVRSHFFAFRIRQYGAGERLDIYSASFRVGEGDQR